MNNDEIEELREEITALRRGAEEHEYLIMALDKILRAVWQAANFDSVVISAFGNNLTNILKEWEFTHLPLDGQAARLLREWAEMAAFDERFVDPEAAARHQRDRWIVHEQPDIPCEQTAKPDSDTYALSPDVGSPPGKLEREDEPKGE
jgi:hypothetical protein